MLLQVFVSGVGKGEPATKLASTIPSKAVQVQLSAAVPGGTTELGLFVFYCVSHRTVTTG